MSIQYTRILKFNLYRLTEDDDLPLPPGEGTRPLLPLLVALRDCRGIDLPLPIVSVSVLEDKVSSILLIPDDGLFLDGDDRVVIPC
jgi:hypothetical protein